MEVVTKMTGLALTAAILCQLIRGNAPALSGVLRLCACTGILLMALALLRPVLTVLQNLRELTGMTQATTAPLYKSIGIGVLTQVCGAVCEDAEEKTLAKAVEIGGTILSLSVSVPLISALLTVLQEALGG